MIKILLVDDQELLRDSVGYILNNDNDIDVVGSASNGKEAFDMCQKLSPDIILMDIEMPEVDGVSATHRIKSCCDAKIVILTTFENPDNVMEAFMAGADGYLLKDIKHHDLIVSIKCINAGLTVIHESVKKIMLDRFKGISDCKVKYKELLNELEIEIVKLIALGKANKEIGHTLSYSEGTIKNKISKILSKLDMSDRMQIAIFAMENGIV